MGNPFAGAMGSPPCNTPNGICIPIEPNEIVLIFFLIFGVYLILNRYFKEEVN